MRDRVLRQGRVVNAEGQPVAQALVTVSWGTAPTPETAHRTDAAGAFTLGLAPGRYRLLASAAGGLTGTLEVDGGEGPEILIRVAPRAGQS